MPDPQRNWAGNIAYGAARWRLPETVEAARRAVAEAPRLRAVGSRHSFNRIADSDADMLSTAGLARILDLDAARGTVTVEAGIGYGDLAAWLHERGHALHNLASLPHISIGGAISTATHGSGDGNGNLATAVSGIELIAADGSLVALDRDRDADIFPGAVVGLGATGVIARVRLDVRPAFQARQSVHERAPLAAVIERFDEIMASAYSVSLFTRWRDGVVDQIWVKSVADGDAPFAHPALEGFAAATVARHPILALSAANCTAQLGAIGPWHERLPHFRPDFTPSSGEELQSEYFVPRSLAAAALSAVAAIGERMAPLLMISEIRSIAADDLWMSPCYGEACIGLHFTWRSDWPAVSAFLPIIEAALAPFDPRPHWGKLFTMEAARFQARYPRLDDFRTLCRRFDPGGKFRNPFVDAILG